MCPCLHAYTVCALFTPHAARKLHFTRHQCNEVKLIEAQPISYIYVLYICEIFLKQNREKKWVVVAQQSHEPRLNSCNDVDHTHTHARQCSCHAVYLVFMLLREVETNLVYFYFFSVTKSYG